MNRTMSPATAALPEVVDAILPALRAWCEAHGSIRELWLFGSQAKGTARPDSDIDLAIVLAPPTGSHDWARGNYMAEGDDWQRELAGIAGRHVSLQELAPEIEDSAVLLWRRSAVGR